MKCLSSDYPNATGKKLSRKSMQFITGDHNPSEAEFFGFVQAHEQGSDYDENMQNIHEVFGSISQAIMNGAPNTALSSSAIMKDIISDNFNLPEGFSAANITARTVKCTAINTSAAGAAAYTFDEEHPTDLATADIAISGKTITVKGFNYSEDYCYALQNRVEGKKLVVEISGLEAKSDLFGEGIPTNDPDLSGIYPNEVAEKPDPKLIFPLPTVDIPRLVYVYDFGLDIDFGSNVLHDFSSISDITFHDCYKKGPAPEQFGVEISANSKKITFNEQPGDPSHRTIGAFVTRTEGGKDFYEWTRVEILPATTVFYEESFMNYENGSFGGELTANWEAVGSASGAMQSCLNKDYGYDAVYEGGYGDSLGSAKKINVSREMYNEMYGGEGGSWPMASFTFKGTDISIIGKVGPTMGIVAIQVRDSEGGVVSNVLADTYSRLELSQVPIYRLSEKAGGSIEYGTYTMNLCPVYLPWMDKTKNDPQAAIAAHEEELRKMLGWDGDVEIEFYAMDEGGERDLRGSGSYDVWLDGFRVYEPLGSELDAVAAEAYAAAA